MDETEPVSQAIRAMGTNSLPFLLAHIKHIQSPLLVKLVALLRKQTLVKLPFYGEEAYQSPSILALDALGSQALPLLPELSSVAQDPQTCWWGMISLLAIGTNSIPSLERACQSIDIQVRTNAVLTIAMLGARPTPHRRLPWGWHNAPLNGKRLLGLSRMVTWMDVAGIVTLLEHSDPAVRRASAEALAPYTRPHLYAGIAAWAIPSLTKALKDEEQGFSKAAGETLKLLDPVAAAKAGVK